MCKASNPIPSPERFSDGIPYFLNYASKVTAYDRSIITLGIESRPVRRVERNCFGANQDVVVPELRDRKQAKSGVTGSFPNETVVLLQHLRRHSRFVDSREVVIVRSSEPVASFCRIPHRALRRSDSLAVRLRCCC